MSIETFEKNRFFALRKPQFLSEMPLMMTVLWYRQQGLWFDSDFEALNKRCLILRSTITQVYILDHLILTVSENGSTRTEKRDETTLMREKSQTLI